MTVTDTTVGLRVGAISEDWSGDARYFEYSRAANPIGSGYTPRIPLETFSSRLHKGGPTRVVPLDLSAALGIEDGPATSPALLASFLHIRADEKLSTAPNATSELYFVLRGSGVSVVDGEVVTWSAGDFLTLPAGCRSTHHAAEDTAIYWVTDEPLLRYLGVRAVEARFRPTKFEAARVRSELEKVAASPRAAERNRISVLLANATQTQTLTATHVLWAMYGIVPARSSQRPHRHQSVALDLCLDCAEGSYTLVGSRLDADGSIVDPVKVDWSPGSAFVTPPGLWHAHYNDSDRDAWIIPVQDAGLQTYLRSLDIRFAPPRSGRTNGSGAAESDG